jgi:hypothetical protein
MVSVVDGTGADSRLTEDRSTNSRGAVGAVVETCRSEGIKKCEISPAAASSATATATATATTTATAKTYKEQNRSRKTNPHGQKQRQVGWFGCNSEKE